MSVPAATASEFQHLALSRVECVLRDANVSFTSTERRVRGVLFVVKFSVNGLEHEIDIGEDNAAMTSGKSLRECFLASEFRSPRTLADSFSDRLRRYVSGEEW